jgi:hypothetical protein
MTDIEKAEYDVVVRSLTTELEKAVSEIDRLRAVVAKLTGTEDAHSTLDEAQPVNARVRAAAAAMNFEKPSLKPQPAPLELVAEEIEPLADVVARQRARADRMLLEDPQFLAVRSISLKGNGADDGSDSDDGSND